ncbi:MAG: hypothetical protein IKO35_05870, partial [Elusimicrobiaceae bacterium]|nr:hypothetical protein [Elusimicrobiaceae bacterium]
MKWFHFLTSKAGKLTIGVPQMAAIVGVGLVVSYSAFQVDKAAVEQEKIRSLSSISSSYNYGGMRQDGRGSLTSINVKDGLNQVATAEERARIEAGRTGGGDFGLGAADNMGRSVSGALTGVAAQTTDTEGLGMGRNAVTMDESGSAGGAQAPGVNVEAVSQKAAAGRSASATQTSQLSSASMARASGSGISSSFGGDSSAGGAAGRGASSGAAAGRSGRSSRSADGYQFTGSMPSGTNPVSLGGADGRSASHFVAGGRNASVGSSRTTKGTGNDLKDISKRSADAARNSFRSANEGSRAFLASSQNSGGLDLSSDVETTETGSADFEAPEASKLKAIGDWGDKTNDEEKERAKKRMLLVTAMMAYVVATMLAVKLIKYLMTAAENSSFCGVGFAAWAWIVCVAMLVAAIAVSAIAAQFGNDYDWPALPYIVMGVVGICAGWVLTTTILGEKDKLTGTNDEYKNAL